MFVITVHFEITAGHEQEFARAVLTQAQNSLDREQDCHVFDVCVALEAPGSFFLYEQYTDAAAFESHCASAHFKSFDERVRPWVASKAVQKWLVAEQPQ